MKALSTFFLITLLFANTPSSAQPASDSQIRDIIRKIENIDKNIANISSQMERLKEINSNLAESNKVLKSLLKKQDATVIYVGAMPGFDTKCQNRMCREKSAAACKYFHFDSGEPTRVGERNIESSKTTDGITVTTWTPAFFLEEVVCYSSLSKPQ
jgi:uncharacterized protein (UPF0335 family)